MTSRERLMITVSFREPDRVPIELYLPEKAKAMPECSRLVEFMNTDADNFKYVDGANWGFLGLPSQYSEETIEDVPGEYRRIRRSHKTDVAGEFYAITRHSYPHLDSADFHWERRYIETLEEMERLADAPRVVCPIFPDKFQRGIRRIGERGVSILTLLHPLGALVRSARMEEAYAWLLTEPALMHRFLENANNQVRDTVLAMGAAGIGGWFVAYAHEMLIPPWMGFRQFDEVVFPYDKLVNDAIHKIGGKFRSHCHGNCMQFLERMSRMGVDATEPLEPPPFGDVDLAEAKRLVGDRMVLSGNIPSQSFTRMTREEVRESVRAAIAAAAAGGGFTLRTTGSHAGVDPDLDKDVLLKIISNAEAFIEAGMELGRYG